MMQNHKEVEGKYFLECKDALENLLSSQSMEELVQKHNLLQRVAEQVTFFKILEENKLILGSESDSQIAENQDVIMIPNPGDIVNANKQEIGNIDAPPPIIQFDTENYNSEDAVSEIYEAENIETDQLEINNDYQQIINNLIPGDSSASLQEDENRTPDAPVPDFLEEDKGNVVTGNSVAMDEQKGGTDLEHNLTPQQRQDKKFRLANIKGLKPIQSLFDDEIEEQPENLYQKTTETEVKNNISDPMFTDKHKIDFRLDLNDKFAFTKTLFNGSQVDLNNAINKLNSFNSLDEAKEYLSDLYYERNWVKVDETAQRLWALVENKFL